MNSSPKIIGEIHQTAHKVFPPGTCGVREVRGKVQIDPYCPACSRYNRPRTTAKRLLQSGEPAIKIIEELLATQDKLMICYSDALRERTELEERFRSLANQMVVIGSLAQSSIQ